METITLWRNNKNITLWIFIYEAMLRCVGG